MNTAKLVSIQVGLPQTIPGEDGATDAMRKGWTTAFFKQPVSGAVRLTRTNLAGDGQADLRFHGGADKAVNVYASEHYPYWQHDLRLSEMPYGAFGENFTVQGLVETDVCIGDVFRVGETLVQVSQPRQPCGKLARRWRMKDLVTRVQRTRKTGWYLRVLEEGFVEAGQPLELIERLHPEWTVEAANLVMYNRKADFKVMQELAHCPALSASWRGSLLKRAAERAQSKLW